MPEGDTQINPGLSAQIEVASIGSMRGRLAMAFAVYSGEMSDSSRVAFAQALGEASPVDCAVKAFDALHSSFDSLGAVMLARLVEVAEMIALNNWHGKADEAQAAATAARARKKEV